MTTQNTSQQSLSILSVLICIILTGITAMILSLLISQFNWPDIYSSMIPVIVAVFVGMLGMYGWQKGFKNLNRNDLITSFMGGMGATIGLIIVEIFS